MKLMKLKVESKYGEYFFSYNKSGVRERYLNQKEEELPNFSYLLVTEDKLSFVTKDKSYFCLNEIFISLNKRGSGLAKKLITDMINFMSIKHKGYSIILEANDKWANSNIDGLRNLYSGLGFKDIGNNFFELVI